MISPDADAFLVAFRDRPRASETAPLVTQQDRCKPSLPPTGERLMLTLAHPPDPDPATDDARDYEDEITYLAVLALLAQDSLRLVTA